MDRLYFDAASGKLKGTLRDVDPAFTAAVREGRYKKVSVCLHRPDSSFNPVPGVNYLRHVGFLGGAAPAVTGLKPVSFTAGAETLDFASDFDARDVAALEAAGIIATLRAENEELRRQIAALKPAAPPPESPEFAAMRGEVESFRREKLDHELEKLIDQGRLLPVFKAGALDFAASLEASDTLSFSAGTQVTQRDWFMGFLARLPQVVSFGAMDLPPGPLAGEARPAGLAPRGYTTDPAQDELYQRARRIEAEKGISFAATVDLAQGEMR